MKQLLALLVLASFANASAPCFAQETGRLFFTPEQRQALDARRRARLPDRPSAPVIASPATRLDGYVSRDNGKSTVWVNGEPLPETAPEAPRIGGSGRVTVNVGDGGARGSLRPGETLDRGTGEVKDVLGNGEIRIERRPER
jgi:hypothetical protein